MSIELYTGAAQLHTLEQWQANIAHNLSNSETPGFQQSRFEIRGHRPAEIQNAEASGDVVTAFPLGRTRQLFGAGELQVTGNPYDFAIQGEGFFAVRTSQGQMLYTKDGEFHPNAQGVLVNKVGYPVLSGGEEIQIRMDEGPVSVAEDGTLSQNGREIAQLSVFRANSPQNLSRGNGSYFMDLRDEAGMEEVEQPTVLQGQLQMSSVQPLREMVSMIKAARAYEITQKMVQSEDQRLEQAIQTFSV